MEADGHEAPAAEPEPQGGSRIVLEYNGSNQKGTEMNSRILGLRVAGTIFGLMCIAQLLRLISQAEVVVAGHQLPLWASTIAVVILGGLSLWLLKLSRST
jgi:hypothetical protein